MRPLLIAVSVCALVLGANADALRGDATGRKLTELREREVMQAIYDHIFFAYIVEPNTGTSSFTDDTNYKKTMFSLCYPALPVDPNDFKDQYDYISNPSGKNMDGYMKMYQMYGNHLLKLGPIAESNVGSISDLYGRVTKAQPKSADEFSDSDKEMYASARDILFENRTKYEMVGKKPKKVTVEEWSDQYLLYQELQDTYEDALHDQLSLRSKYDLSVPAQQIEWMRENNYYQRKTERAWQELQSRGSYEIIQWAIAILSQYGASSIVKEFMQAKSDFDSFKASSTNPLFSEPYYPTYIMPSNWYDSDADWWTTAEFGTSESQHTLSHFNDVGRNSFSGGLFSIKPKKYLSQDETKKSSSTDTFKIKFSYAKVQIVRPWLKEHLFLLKNWFILDAPKGSFSTGVLADSNKDTLFPVLPDTMIMVKDVEINADWSQEDETFMKSQFAGKSGFGFGPFSFGPTQKETEETYDFAGTFEGGVLQTGPDPQVLGFMSKLLPYMPPEDSN